jgi:hypothetical protein
MILIAAALALVVGFIVGTAWPKVEAPAKEWKVIGYDRHGMKIYERPEVGSRFDRFG